MSQYYPAHIVVSHELREWSLENGQDACEDGESVQLPAFFNYLLGHHPHGPCAIGAVMAYGSESLNFSKIFPGIRPYLTTMDSMFSIPFSRDMALFCGAVSVSRESLVYLLDKSTTGVSGNLVVVAVGGLREVLESRPGRYNLVLNRRRGFFRIALETGVYLIPSISFGETNLYDQVANPDGSILRKMQEWVLAKFKLAYPFFYSSCLIHYPRPITIVVGRPIACRRIPNPTDEEVNNLREVYKQQLVQLFNRYRPLYDPTAEDIRFI
ncbi:hypothetical protein Aperf_G00000110315 [Anoplocephala perfoliata]